MDISKIIGRPVFEEKLGKIHANDIRNLTFVEPPSEYNDVTVAIANISTVIACPLSGEQRQEASVREHMEFFTEAIEKIQVLAVENYVGIRISPHYAPKALSAIKIYVDKVISGDPKYIRYMEDIDTDLDAVESLSKCLVISLSGSVAKINQDDEGVEYGLYWSATVVEKHWDGSGDEDDPGYTSLVDTVAGY
jgi:hypothetical protein